MSIQSIASECSSEGEGPWFSISTFQHSARYRQTGPRNPRTAVLVSGFLAVFDSSCRKCLLCFSMEVRQGLAAVPGHRLEMEAAAPPGRAIALETACARCALNAFWESGFIASFRGSCCPLDRAFCRLRFAAPNFGHSLTGTSTATRGRSNCASRLPETAGLHAALP